MKFIKKLNKQHGNPEIIVEGAIKLEKSETIEMVKIEYDNKMYVSNICPGLKDKPHEFITFKANILYEITIYSHYDFTLDEDIDLINEALALNELIKIVVDTCNDIYILIEGEKLNGK